MPGQRLPMRKIRDVLRLTAAAGLGHHRRPDLRSDILGEIPPPVLNQVANLGSYSKS